MIQKVISYNYIQQKKEKEKKKKVSYNATL